MEMAIHLKPWTPSIMASPQLFILVMFISKTHMVISSCCKVAVNWFREIPNATSLEHSSIFSSSCGTSLFTNLYVYRHGEYSLNNCDCINMYCALHIHTMVVPRCGLHSITDPKPASSSILIALTAPSLFPLSRKRLATRRALIWRTFPGRRRQYAASERSSDPGQVLMLGLYNKGTR